MKGHLSWLACKSGASDEAAAGRDKSLDPSDPAVIEARDFVRWELEFRRGRRSRA